MKIQRRKSTSLMTPINELEGKEEKKTTIKVSEVLEAAHLLCM
jgi:hypothetical protein